MSEMNLNSCVASCIKGRNCRRSKYNKWSEVFPWLQKREDGLHICQLCQTAEKTNAYSAGIRITVLRTSRFLKHELSKDHLDASGQQCDDVMEKFKERVSQGSQNGKEPKPNDTKCVLSQVLTVPESEGGIQEHPPPPSAIETIRTDQKSIWRSAFFNEAAKMRNEGFLCDVHVHLLSGSRKLKISAHKLILASASAYFAESFRQDKDCSIYEVTLRGTQYTSTCVETVMNYLYGVDPTGLSYDVLQSSIELANELAMSHVVSDFNALLTDAAPLSSPSVHDEHEESDPTDLNVEQIIKDFPCEICSENFATKILLKKHKNTTHRVKSSIIHVCKLCGKTFNRPYRLREHMNHHRGIQSFLCPHCGSMFSARDSLLQHLRTHQGNNRRQFSCTMCEKSFVKHSSLSLHIAIKHKNLTGQHVCDVCGKTFSWPQVLRNHRLTHKPDSKKHACDQCHQRFHTLAHLKRHKKTHNVTAPIIPVLHNNQFNQIDTQLSCPAPSYDHLQTYMQPEVTQTTLPMEQTPNPTWGYE